MWAFSAFALVRLFIFFYRGKQESKERTFPPPPTPTTLALYFLSLSPYYILPLSSYTPLFFIACPSLFRVHIYRHIFVFFLSPIYLRFIASPHTRMYRPTLFKTAALWKGASLFCDLMSNKIKGVSLGSTTPYGVGLCEDDRARMKYQTLMQDYHELQKVYSFLWVLIFCFQFGRSEVYLLICFLGCCFNVWFAWILTFLFVLLLMFHDFVWIDWSLFAGLMLYFPPLDSWCYIRVSRE